MNARRLKARDIANHVLGSKIPRVPMISSESVGKNGDQVPG